LEVGQFPPAGIGRCARQQRRDARVTQDQLLIDDFHHHHQRGNHHHRHQHPVQTDAPGQDRHDFAVPDELRERESHRAHQAKPDRVAEQLQQPRPPQIEDQQRRQHAAAQRRTSRRLARRGGACGRGRAGV